MGREEQNLILIKKFAYYVLGKENGRLQFNGVSPYDLCAMALQKIGINQNQMQTRKFVKKNLGTIQNYLVRQQQIHKPEPPAKPSKNYVIRKITIDVEEKPRQITPKNLSYLEKMPSKPIVIKPKDYSKANFLKSYEWRKLRMEALIKYGRKCVCCGATPETGAVMNVDHIKPRKTHPELALDINNLQVLCSDCNHGKGNWDSTDWRNL
jgi:hypothetical protein